MQKFLLRLRLHYYTACSGQALFRRGVLFQTMHQTIELLLQYCRQILMKKLLSTILKKFDYTFRWRSLNLLFTRVFSLYQGFDSRVFHQNPSHIKHQEYDLLCVQKCNESGIEEKFTKQAIKIIMELQIDIWQDKGVNLKWNNHLCHLCFW